MPVKNFQNKWKNDYPWVKEGKTVGVAECIWCNATITYDTMGRSSLTSHEKGRKHMAMAKNVKQIPEITNFTTSSENNTTTTQSTPVTVSVGQPNPGSSKQHASSTLEKFLLQDKTTEAEIMWCVNTVVHHNSLRNAESSVLLFKQMFKDSSIANQMKLHKDKISYSIVFGIAPYFKEILKSTLSEDDTFYVIGFDESLNKVAQRTQMDLSVRFWDKECNLVKTRYLSSVFMDKAKATDLLEAFKNGIKGLKLSNILQISMDGPNVNWAFLKLMKKELSETLGPDAPQLLEIGSCGLHVIHGAFKNGINKTNWNIIQFLRALYNLFKMVPARRGQYIEITNSNLFPLQFCTIRWVESAIVAKRAIDMLPNLRKYVDDVQGTDKEPTCFSFKIVQQGLKDKLLLAKLAFFQSLAEECEPFLKEFQSDSPMIPFLYDSLIKLLQIIMTKFVKEEEMRKPNFFNVDVFEKEDDIFKALLKVKNVELGYATRAALRKCIGVENKDVIGFRKDIRACYQHLVAKIQEKSPLKYPLTKAISCFNPKAVLTDYQESYKNLKKLLDILIASNIIHPSDAEKADLEYKEIVSEEVFRTKAAQFSRKEERVDSFWVKEVAKTEKLKEVLKKCLVLSHGNANLERGFSINKEILVENLREDSLIAQRIIYDAISDAGGQEKWTSMPIPRKLIFSMRSAYSRMKEHEEQRKKTMTEKDRLGAQKRKEVFELEDLKEKRKKLAEKMNEELFMLDQQIRHKQMNSK